MSQQITCPKCRHPFFWNGSDAVAVCRSCGTQYKMHPQTRSQDAVLMPPLGRGRVDHLTVLNESTIRNRPLLKSYLPPNWSYQCTLANDRFDLVSNPMVLSLSLLSPDRSAKIVFTGECFYKHIEPSPQTAALQNRLEDLTLTRTPMFFRLKSYQPAAAYCDTLAQGCGLTSLSVRHERQTDPEETVRQQRLVQHFLSKGFDHVSAAWAGKTYCGTSAEGHRRMVYAETRVLQLMRQATVQNVQLQPVPGMFGMRMVPQMVAQQVQERYWATSYEFTLLSSETAFEQAYTELQRINATLDYLPAMETVRAEMMSLVQNAQMGIAQAQAASWDRRSQIIADTNTYTSHIQHQMMADNAAAHDRAAGRYSEMIREVNTYRGYDGTTVEAPTRYDHVYQHRQDPDLYAVQQGDSLTFGIDFEELPKQ